MLRAFLPCGSPSEKIQKMQFMLTNKDRTYAELLADWKIIQKEIEEETLPLNK